MKRFEFSIIIALILTIIVTIFSGFTMGQSVRDNVIRFHIRANSNSKEDQDIKIKVRDYVIKNTSHLFNNVNTNEEAEKIIKNNIPTFEKAANEKLKQLNVPYKAKAEIKQDYFPTREYKKVTLPAGNYEALIIYLGTGKGDNWWCVFFPPMCYSGESLVLDNQAMTYLKESLTLQDYDLITAEKPKTVYKFKIIEFFSKFKF